MAFLLAVYTTLFNRLPNHMLTTSHNRRYDGISVEECARHCILETYFKCQGFDYEIAPQVKLNFCKQHIK